MERGGEEGNKEASCFAFRLSGAFSLANHQHSQGSPSPLAPTNTAIIKHVAPPLKSMRFLGLRLAAVLVLATTMGQAADKNGGPMNRVKRMLEGDGTTTAATAKATANDNEIQDSWATDPILKGAKRLMNGDHAGLLMDMSLGKEMRQLLSDPETTHALLQGKRKGEVVHPRQGESEMSPVVQFLISFPFPPSLPPSFIFPVFPMFKVLPGVEALSAKAKEDFTAEDVRMKEEREHVLPCIHPPRPSPPSFFFSGREQLGIPSTLLSLLPSVPLGIAFFSTQAVQLPTSQPLPPIPPFPHFSSPNARTLPHPQSQTVLASYKNFVTTAIKGVKDMANPINLAGTMQKVADSMQPVTQQADGTHRALTTEERRMTELVGRVEVSFFSRICVATSLCHLSFLISLAR